MTRDEIISSLKQLSDTERLNLEERLDACNVRVVRASGVTPEFGIRGPYGARMAMERDETVERVEYQYNGKWMLVA